MRAPRCGRRVADAPVADLAEADSRKALADPLRSASILVAEDNDVNQEVIRRQLTLLGFRHEIASTGADALRRLSNGSYTLLITDIHMPVMDGYELTTKVREREAATGSPRMPIIAITANALKSEAERCISVGMDDYLSKPVSSATLRAMLERWTSAGLTNAEGGSEEPASAEDRSVVDAGVRAKFRDSLEQSVADIRKAVAQEKWYDAGFHAHRLKSAALAVGAGELAKACARVEVAGLARSETGVREALAAFEEAAERERRDLRG